jgi:hypothetical protein
MSKLSLPNLSLLIVDCVEYNRAKLSFDHCCSYIDFGDAKILTHFDIEADHIVKIPQISDIDSYSNFMVRTLANYITTDYVMVAQWDGFIRNMDMWDDAFLQYDYIGAPWPTHLLFPGVPKKFNVGNGGFSIRSKRLQEFLRDDTNLTEHRLEDVMICQLNRAYLEKCGFTFAPLEIANRFSWECGEHRESFGVHQRIKLVKPQPVITNEQI